LSEPPVAAREARRDIRQVWPSVAQFTPDDAKAAPPAAGRR